MAKIKSQYSCTECGAVSPKWQGQCPGCNAWNTLVETVAENVLADMVTDETEVISIYYGEEVTEVQAQLLNAHLAEKYPLCDVSLFRGGQPLYYYLIAVE